MRNVITSYSIHYTKLYDLADALRQAEGLGTAQVEPVAVPVLASRECTAFELVGTQLARRLRRACGFRNNFV